MKLSAFTVHNFRSITQARRIHVGDTVVLIGPNNEGKSNILRALVTALEMLTQISERFSRITETRFPAFWYKRIYDWNRDYPIHLQTTTPKGASVLRLEFELTQTELDTFQSEIKSIVTNPIPIEFSLGREDGNVKVAKKGPYAKALSTKSGRIAEFIAKRFRFEYIPAIRTASSAEKVVERLVERELSPLEVDPQFKQAMSIINTLQKPVLDRLSASIEQTLVKFLPDIKKVSVGVAVEERIRALRKCDIIVDDGTKTSLQYKGDGVQSLAALGIMRHSSEQSATGKDMLVAIEEPESHLHPSAIHELKSVVLELAKTRQIVLTTHCPVFINRSNIKSNILVVNSRAKPATSLNQIRDILGVRAADNLRNADLVLVIEGDEDLLSLQSLLTTHSPRLADSIKNGALGFDTLGGASNLTYKTTTLRQALCRYHCFLDDDRSGRDAFNKAREQGLVSDSEVNLATCPGFQEAEFEDLIDPSVYADALTNKYRVSVQSRKFKTNKKWSVRMRDTFVQQGKPWDERVESEVKSLVAENVARHPANALLAARRGPFDALIAALTTRLADGS